MELDMGAGFTLQAKRKLEMDSPSQRSTRRRLSSACSSISEELSKKIQKIAKKHNHTHLLHLQNRLLKESLRHPLGL